MNLSNQYYQTRMNGDEAIAKIVEISERRMRETKAEPVLRVQHPKQHGCVWATFIIEENLPEHLQIGVFKQPKNFPAWIRFSNGPEQDDSRGGVHGMAIKLMDVDGKKMLAEEKNAKTQDFVMMDHPVFFIRSVQDYAELLEKIEIEQNQVTARQKELSKVDRNVQKSPLKAVLKFLFPSFNPLKWRLHELRITFSLLVIKRFMKINSPLETQYWSTTPYSLGSQAIKFFVKPLPHNKSDKSDQKTQNYLRKAMSEFLRDKEAIFDFYIQLESDPIKTPVENSTIEWKGAKEYKVATIKIPPQIFESSEQMEFGEQLSYTPWHCLPEHMPLGGINRARKETYQRTSELRHKRNKVSSQEPTPETFKPQLLM